MARAQIPSSSLRRFRTLAGAGLGGLALMGLAYWLTLEPAPAIRVRWRDTLSAARQAELERRYLLAGGIAPMPEAPRSLAYDLLDTSRHNIRNLVTDPDVADTNDLNRDEYFVRPNTKPGERTMWVAYRIPGLRNPLILRASIAALVILAVIGLAGVARERRRLARLGLLMATPRDGDLFDRLVAWTALPGGAVPGEPAHRGIKLAGLVLATTALRVPMIDTWRVLVFAAGVLLTVFGVGRAEIRRLGMALLVVVVALMVQMLLPRADIAEAHNAFMVLGPGEPLERGLPPEIFRSWKAQFEAVYPPQPPPYVIASWRERKIVPTALYAASADALWRRPKYTRQVDAIGFDNLAEFRGGFTNEHLYNFWNGDLSRSVLPFYAMYQLTPATAGSQLSWKGQVFWERADGSFEEVIHAEAAARTIRPEDAGKRVYALFIPARDEHLAFRLLPSATLKASAVAGALVSLGAALTVFTLLIRPRWPSFLRALTLFAAAYRLIGALMAISGAWYLGRLYPAHGGGDDGLAHDGWGHGMALMTAAGHAVTALEGGEPVYWFTPGMRYARMVEKLLFGDTNHLYAIALASVPIVMFYLFRHLIRLRWAWVLTIAFCLMPVGNLSFVQYFTNARVGYAEALGAGFFLLGLVLLLRTQPAWGGTSPDRFVVAVGGVSLAGAMFLRPNFAIAVVWLAAAWSWAEFSRRDFGAIAALGCGLAVACWMPIHNWYYGGEFYAISKSGATISVPLGIRDYSTAARDLIAGRGETAAVKVVSTQVSGWLSGPAFVDLYRERLLPLAWAAHGLRWFALLVACGVAVRWIASGCRRGTTLAVIAVAAVCAEAPMLVVHATLDRYAMLGWDLSLIVLIGLIASLFSAEPQRVISGATLQPSH